MFPMIRIDKWLQTFAIALVSLGASGVNAAESDPIRELRWQSRVLLVFATSMSDAGVAAMRENIDSAKAEVVDRELVIGWVLGDGQSRLGDGELNDDYAAELRARAGVDATSFGVVLIGKDGGIKARYSDVPDLGELFALIDGMPMRRREMRE